MPKGEGRTGKNKLTKAQEVFIHHLLKGSSQREAFLQAYPRARKWKPTSVDCEASKLTKRPNIKQRFDMLLQEFREKEQLSTQWAREHSIATLRSVIDFNIDEIKRINAAFDDEMEMLDKAFIAAQLEGNAGRMMIIVEQMIGKRKTRRLSGTHNSGIINAVGELNKMQGFNEETINLNGSVIFANETELED